MDTLLYKLDDYSSFKSYIYDYACGLKEQRIHRWHTADFRQTAFQDLDGTVSGLDLYTDHDFSDKLKEFLDAPCNQVQLLKQLAAFRAAKDGQAKMAIIHTVACYIEGEISSVNYQRERYSNF